MRSRALALAFLSILAGCKETTDPTWTVVQSFTLESIDADPLTALAGDEGTSEIHPTAEVVELRDNDRARIHLDFIEVIFTGSALPESSRHQTFDYVIFGDSIRISETPGCIIDDCTIARGTIIGDAMTVIRPQWSGTRVFLYSRNVLP
jgi:hypothetical protein